LIFRALERLDFGLDERVELRKLVGDLLGQVEVHACVALCFLQPNSKLVYSKPVYEMGQAKRAMKSDEEGDQDGSAIRPKGCVLLTPPSTESNWPST
jgi:hypothetical protein